MPPKRVETREASETSCVGRWIQLFFICLSCLICSGFVPGASLFIEMFVNAGVSLSACTEMDLDSCNVQYERVSGAFNFGAALVMLGMFPVTIAFDRFGGHMLGYTGALMTCVGTLCLILVVKGAEQGYDAWTSPMLALAVSITDSGSITNSYCLMSLMWHFHDYQSCLFALMAATYSVGALIPNLLQVFMDWSRADLSSCLIILVASELTAAWLCYAFVPSKEEYFEKAREALGMPLPKPKAMGVWTMIKRACRVMRAHWLTHIIMAVSMGICFAAVTMYSSLAGEYAKDLFKTQAATELLPAMYTEQTATIGGFVWPIVCAVLDKTGGATSIMMIMCLVCMVVVTLSITVPDWNAQRLCCIAAAAFAGSSNIVYAKYATKYASPASFAAFLGTVVLSVMLVFCIAVAVYYILGGANDADMTPALLTISASGAVSMSILTIHLQCTGFPETPVWLPEDEAEIAEPFGCSTLDELVYVLHMGSKQELLKEMSKTDAKSQADLMGRIDFARMEDKLGITHDGGVVQVADIDALAACIFKKRANFQRQSLSWISCSSCHCCTDDAEIVLSEPLLEGPSKARLLNEQLIRDVHDRKREKVISLYKEEDTNLLYAAYEDLFEMLDRDQMDAFEKEWEGLFEEEEWLSLTKERPALKVTFMKMMAYKTRRSLFG